MSYYADNRKSIMSTITQRTTDLAAVAEMTLMLKDVKARLRQEEEHVRRKTDEALRCQDELKRSQFLNSHPSAAPPSPGLALALLVVLGAMVVITSVVLLLHG